MTEGMRGKGGTNFLQGKGEGARAKGDTDSSETSDINAGEGSGYFGGRLVKIT